MSSKPWLGQGRRESEEAEIGDCLRSWSLAVWHAWCLSPRKAPEPERDAIPSKLQHQKEIHPPVCDANVLILGWPLTPLCSPLPRKRERVLMTEMHPCSFIWSTHPYSPGVTLAACKCWFVFVQWLRVCQLRSHTSLLTTRGVDFNAFLWLIG